MTIIDTATIERLTGLDLFLNGQILGQEEVIAQIAELSQRAFCGIRLQTQPLGSMLFLGPTGVGKTDTAKLLTERLFGSPEKLIRLDMSDAGPDISEGAERAELRALVRQAMQALEERQVGIDRRLAQPIAAVGPAAVVQDVRQMTVEREDELHPALVPSFKRSERRPR